MSLALRYSVIAGVACVIGITAQGATIVLTGGSIEATNRQYEGYDVIVNNGTVTIDGPHVFNSLTLTNNATLTHPACTATQVFALTLTVSNALSVAGGSKLNATARGYAEGRTYGNTTDGASTIYAGGSYGGLGSERQSPSANPYGTANTTYGDFRNPAEPGSGGAFSASGAGGGLIRITAGAATIDGDILANGGNSYWNGSLSKAGGSGGGIRLDVRRLSGSGTIQANGGSGYSGYCGGGGRIAIYYDAIGNFDLSRVRALGGADNVTGNDVGGVGTVYLKDRRGGEELRVDSQGQANGSPTPLGRTNDTHITVDRLIVSGTGVVVRPLHEMPIVATNLSILNGAKVTSRAATADQTFSVTLTVQSNFVLGAGCRIDVNACGYVEGRTYGNTTNGASTIYAGGSYGGLGSERQSPSANPYGTANTTYGDFRNPAEPGSGGAFSASGAGGGLIRITAGAATIDGDILANGGNSYWNGSLSKAGGSGGGIRLDVGTLSGSGTIQANGGSGYSGYCGGGGRIAIYYDAIGSFDLSRIRALGGADNVTGNDVGGVGTVYLKNRAGEGVLRIANYGQPAGSWTPLGTPSDTRLDVEHLWISGTNVVVAPDHVLPLEAASVTLTNGAVLTHRAATATHGYWLQLTVRGRLSVDVTSKIDVSQRGYPAGHTWPDSTTVGAATGKAGGSYGGLGFESSANWTYGDPRNPNEPGSGGGIWDYGGAAGGGLVRIMAGSIRLDSAILANGGSANAYSTAGSGGGVLLNAGRLEGAGVIRADGGNAGYGGSAGGGRVAIYTWATMTLPANNVTARGGTGGTGPGENGSVLLAQQPYFAWQEPANGLLHGTDELRWLACGADPSQVVAQVRLSRDGQSYTLSDRQPLWGSLPWASGNVPNGQYELRATFLGTNGVVAGEIARTVLVNNSPTLRWHSGTILSNEVWGAGVVHVVEGNLTVPAGVTLTIQPGAVVRFARLTGVTVQSGGTLNALATPAARIVLTSLPDDTAGGDINLDGNASRPWPGDWFGVTVLGTGQFNRTASVDLRYIAQLHSGALAGNETWAGTLTHIVSGEVLVPSGITLTIQPGAVVKFRNNGGLTVQSGGALAAGGTVAQPITFTSVKDDLLGGDSDGDGGHSAPAAGDWRSIRIEGTGRGVLRQAAVRYGGNSIINVYNAGGMIENNGGTLDIGSCFISESLKEGVLGGGTVSISNSVITGTDRGVTAWGGNVTLVNCTVDNNRIGLLEHNGRLTVHNCIVSSNLEAGIVHDLGADQVTVAYSDVWNPGAANYSGTADRTGASGNISTNPALRDAGRGDYRLRYLSPCIDAADGRLCPPSDSMDASRYDDPRTANRGVAMAGGAVPDMGAYEFRETMLSDIDLVAGEVSGPTAAEAGETVTVTWTIRNNGSGSVSGSWHDAVAILPEGQDWDAGLPCGEVFSSASLGPARSATFQAEVRVPGGAEGRWRWAVRANVQGEVFEGARWTNNVGIGAAALDLRVPELTINGPPLARQFGGADQPHWFKFRPAAGGQDVRVAVDVQSLTARTELYVAAGRMPTRVDYDVKHGEGDAADASAFVGGARAQTHYVLVYPRVLPAGSSAFSVAARTIEFSLTGLLSARQVGNAGPVTLHLQGGQLSEGMTYRLVGPGAATVLATAVFAVNSSEVYVTFDMDGQPAGVYRVEAADGGRSVSLPNAMTVTAGNPGHLRTWLSVPTAMRNGRIGTGYLEYRNDGGCDLRAPLVTISGGPGVQVWRSSTGSRPLRQTLQVLAIGRQGPAGVLAPGAGGTVAFSFKQGNPSLAQADFLVASSDPQNLPIDWPGTAEDYRPAFVPIDAWGAVWSNFTARIGNTGPAVAQRLADDATYLSRFGEYCDDSDELMAFELRLAGCHGEIHRRYSLGMLGRGWSDWSMKIQVGPNQEAIIHDGNALWRVFMPVAGSTGGVVGYTASPGDYAWLRNENGRFHLREQHGDVLHFRTDGLLDYAEDPNSNRVSMVYAGTRLIAISNALGDTLRFEYNPAGRVSRMTDAIGRQTVFYYDASGEHLSVILLPDGTSNSCTYVTARGPAREHAVRSVVSRDDQTFEWTYDGQGRPETMKRNGIQVLGWGYGAVGKATVTNALGHVTRLDLNPVGQPFRSTDAMGRTVTLRFDAMHNLTSVEEPDRSVATAQYRDGLPVRMTDRLGNTVVADYDAGYGNLMRVDTRIAAPELAIYQDARGNMKEMLYPNGDKERFGADQRGWCTNHVNARGGSTRFAYTADGRVTREIHPDGTAVVYGYDGRRNLTSAVKTSGFTSLTNTLAYDALDRLVRVTDPAGRSLWFAYDAAGRRTNMTDGAGLNVSYVYDRANRLAALFVAGGLTNVSYAYDEADRLVRQTAGNGMVTTYEYDNAGQMLRLINTASNGTVISRFVYTYDANGRRISMTTLDGRYDYGYDAVGQLTSVTTPSGRAITYTYDANGNRVSVTDAGVTTRYGRNALNQYTMIGDMACTYDADGNLIAMVRPDGTRTYTYDDQNRLVRAEGPDGVQECFYDALGRQFASAWNGARTEYLTDPAGMGDVVAEYGGGGTLRARYVHGLGLVSRIAPNGAISVYAFDALGNTTEVVGPQGQVLNRYAYLPFGETLSATQAVENPFQFVGQWGVRRETCGLDYMRNRYYASSMGRFASRDPIQILGGLNLYCYVGNSPVMAYDPRGMSAILYGALPEVADLIIATGKGAHVLIQSLAGMDPQLIAMLQGVYETQGLKAALELLVGWRRMAVYQVMEGMGLLGKVEAIAASRALWAARWATARNVAWRAASNPYAIAAVGGVVVGTGLRYIPGFDEGAQSFIAWSTYHLWDRWFVPSGPQPSGRTRFVGSEDPNDIAGPAGYGIEGYVLPDQTMFYRIRFENKTNATASAQVVVVSNAVSPNLDFGTFRLGDMGFGTNTVNVPAGRTWYQARVDALSSVGVYVDINADFNTNSGLAVWTFRSVDPVTQADPEDPFAGFLPPNTNPPAGEGWLEYSVRPSTNALNMERIEAQASIVFDVNAPIMTPRIANTVDALAPTSAVAALPAVNPAIFTVKWGGRDVSGSGIVGYDILVARDSGPYSSWLVQTTNVSGVFTGVVGSTYGFYSVARDGVGHSEIAPSDPDARVYVSPDRLYAARGGAHAFPFTNWVGAATNLQSAVNAAGDGAMVLVTDGVYEVTAPVAITNGVWVQSVNGPEETLVDARGRSGCAVVNHSNAVLEGFALMGGNADTGGGVRVGTRGGLVRYCVLTGNRARVGGGAHLVAGTLRNCVVAENAATDRGGGVALDAGAIESSTVAYNAATNGGGGVSAGAGALVRNTIVWDNRARGGANWQNAGGDAAWWYSCTTPSPGAGNNVTNAPGFVNGPAGDYRLADGSPCIDAGINRDWMSGAVDLAGSERINNGTVDIGAYEAQGRPSLWVGSADLGGGWRRLDWFGAFWDPASGWIYHAEHGWMYALADTTSSIWFYTFDLGWLWSASWAYPWLWRANDGAWLYYFRDTSPRAFYNVTTGQAEWH